MKYGIDLGRQPGKSFVTTVARVWPGNEFKVLAIDEMSSYLREGSNERHWRIHPKQLEHLTREQELFAMCCLPGKTPSSNFIQQLVEGWANESRRDSQREAAEDLRPRWLSVRILQLTGLDAHARSLTTQIAFPWHHGRAAGKAARLQELSDRLPELQLITSDEVRSRILFGRSSEDWRALGRYLAASEGLPTKETQ